MYQDKSMRATVEHAKLIKIVIVGVGSVGSATAYTLILSGIVNDLVLIDVNREKAEGESMDLNHAAPSWASARAGNYSDCKDADIFIITCGVSQTNGQTRMDLAAKNTDIMRDVVSNVAQNAPDTILLIATNPVDVLTYVSYEASGFPLHRVIGSGTVLDTARFKHILGNHFKVPSNTVEACVIGEHGDSSVAAWSLTNIKGMKLREYCEKSNQKFDEEAFQKVFEQTRDAAYDIIKRKGCTSYGIAAGLLRIVRAILANEDHVLPVSTVGAHFGIDHVALSVPTKLNRGGAYPAGALTINEREMELARKSAEKIKSVLDKVFIK